MRDFANVRSGSWAKHGAWAGLTLLFAVAFAGLGPFNSYRHDWLDRLGYWTLLFSVLYGLRAVTAPLLGRLPLWSRLQGWQQVALTVAVLSLPMLPVVMAATREVTGWQALPMSPLNIVELLMAIWLISALYLVAGARLERRLPDHHAFTGKGGAAPSSPVASPMPAAPRDAAFGLLAQRLPPAIGTDLVCLHVEDHYVRVHTRKGSALVLMSFSSALTCVSHLDGLQVHRSWWVAGGAIAQVMRSGRTARITLDNGMVVPVSQRYRTAALASGRPVP